MDVDHGAQQSPGAALPVNVQHSEYLHRNIVQIPAFNSWSSMLSNTTKLIKFNQQFEMLTCRNLIPLMAEVANTLEKMLEPLSSTMAEAETTTRSVWSLHG